MMIYENKRLATLLFFIRPISKAVGLFLPNLESELVQSSMKVKKENFISICVFLSTIYVLSSFLIVQSIFAYSSEELSNNLTLSIIISLAVGIFSLYSFINYPKLVVLKKTKKIDNALLFALRHILIKIKSGIPFFNAMVSIAYSNYGQVSEEFKKVIKDVEAGTPEVEALEKISFMTPSHYFRKFVWQVTNSLRAGTDVETALSVIVKNLQDDRYIKIKEFGNKLSPIALMYIVFTVIFPAIILTIFSITSFFFNLEVGSLIFFIMPVILSLFNLFFMSVINSNLPPLSEDY